MRAQIGQSEWLLGWFVREDGWMDLVDERQDYTYVGQGRHGQEDIGARAALHSAMERLIETNPVEAKLSLSTR